MSYNSNRLAGLHIYSILLEHTGDKEHRLTHKQIAYYLKRDYGIELERKAISIYLKELEACEELNVETTPKGSCAYGKLDDSELRVLIDSVLSSKFIDKKRSHELIQKLCSLSHERFKPKSIYSIDSTVKSENKSLLSNVDLIVEAIDKGKKIKFMYNNYEADKKLHPISDTPFVVIPYQLFMSDGKYYLFGLVETEKNYFKFELDKITACNIIEKSAETQINYTDIYAFVEPKELVNIKMKVEAYAINDVITYFGKDISIAPSDDNSLEVRFEADLNDVCQWALRHGDIAEIVYPNEARQKIRKIISRMNTAYIKDDEIKQVIIPNGTTEISEWDDLIDGIDIDYLFIPKSIIKINPRAFYGISSIAKIEVDKDNPIFHSHNDCIIETETNTLVLGGENSIIPKYVTRIGKSAFNGRGELKSIEIHDGVLEIGYMAFCQTGLKDIKIPKSVKAIDSFAFAFCNIKNIPNLDEQLEIKGHGIFADILEARELLKKQNI